MKKFLKKQEKELQKSLEENQQHQREINQKEWLEKRNLNIGDVISFQSSTLSIGRVFGKLDHLMFDNDQKVSYPMIKLLNNKGRCGKRIVRVWLNEVQTITKDTFKPKTK